MERLIDDLIIIQDDLGSTDKNEIHSMYGKNTHESDENLVTEFVFTSPGNVVFSSVHATGIMIQILEITTLRIRIGATWPFNLLNLSS